MANLRWIINENGEKVLQYRQFILGEGEHWEDVPYHNVNLEHTFKEDANGTNCLICGQTITHDSHKRNGGQICDTDKGPCACGAWHKPEIESLALLQALLKVKNHIVKKPGFATNSDFVEILNIINPYVFDKSAEYIEVDFSVASTRKIKPLTDYIEKTPSQTDAYKERAVATLIAVNNYIDALPESITNFYLKTIKNIIKDYSK